MVALLVGAVVSGYRMRPSDRPCPSVKFIIKDRAERLYLTEQELNSLLQSENLYPVGKVLDEGVLYHIEKTVKSHPMVRTAECYVTVRDEVRIRITQRVPLLRVQTAAGETYLIDTDRRVMQARASVKDEVPVVTGTVGVKMAASQMADFAEWLQNNDYWRNAIHHVRVQSPQMIYVYLRGENRPRIVLGGMNRYEQKLAKLRIFLEKGGEATQGKQYTELDLRFKGQVIGRQ